MSIESTKDLRIGIPVVVARNFYAVDVVVDEEAMIAKIHSHNNDQVLTVNLGHCIECQILLILDAERERMVQHARENIEVMADISHAICGVHGLEVMENYPVNHLFHDGDGGFTRDDEGGLKFLQKIATLQTLWLEVEGQK